MLGLRFSRKASRFLEKCDNDLYRRIMEKIRELLVSPYPSESAKVEGRQGNF